MDVFHELEEANEKIYEKNKIIGELEGALKESNNRMETIKLALADFKTENEKLQSYYVRLINSMN